MSGGPHGRRIFGSNSLRDGLSVDDASEKPARSTSERVRILRSRARSFGKRAALMIKSWSSEERDAVLYAASALFAICTAEISSISLYRQWGRLAVGPYAAAAIWSAFAARRQRRRAAVAQAAPLGPDSPASDSGSSWHWTGTRTVIFLLVLLGATLVPLSLEVLWQSNSVGTAHVQPEVAVVEQAGQRLAHRQDPYRLVDGARVRPQAPPGQPSYDVYNPYLPLMSVFGLARSTHASPRLTDARVAFSLITVIVVIAALALCRGPTGPRVLTLQSMTVFPTAALPLATGGDDLPVAAFMLLALVLMQRRRPLASGLALGVAASMKITAWPLAAIAFFGARDRQGRNGRRPALLLVGGMAAVMIPAILPTVAENVPAFVDNVVRFPLGLAGISSPAQSPLLGHLIVSAFPGIHRAFTIIVAAAGVVLLVYFLARHTPRSAADLSRLLGWVMLLAVLLAPATRLGYLLYPVNFFVWAWLLRSEETSSQAALSKEPHLLVVEDADAHSMRQREPAAFQRARSGLLGTGLHGTWRPRLRSSILDPQ
jgi:hypothetical protein